jgi:predicted enzyme related to lactoylglutathione lyase
MNRTKNLFLACLLFLTALLALLAEPPGSTAKVVTVSRAFFALSVADVGTISAWYVDNLGFQVGKSGRNENAGMEFALLSRSDTLVEVIKFKAAKTRAGWNMGATQVHEVHGIMKIGFEVADIDALYKLAKERRLRIFFDIIQAPDLPLRTFGLSDPEGNIVQIFGK